MLDDGQSEQHVWRSLEKQMCPLNHSRLIPMKFHILGIPQLYSQPYYNLHFLRGPDPTLVKPSLSIYWREVPHPPSRDAVLASDKLYCRHHLIIINTNHSLSSLAKDRVFHFLGISLWMLWFGICQNWFCGFLRLLKFVIMSIANKDV